MSPFDNSLDNTVDDSVVEWLYAHAGPIIRWRLIRDFGVSRSHAEVEQTRQAVLASAEVQHWLGNLGGSQVHGRLDTDAENGMAKLVEYGLHAGMAELDAKMLPYADRIVPDRQAIDHASFAGMMTSPFLIRAGYAMHPAVRAYFLQRLAVLHATAVAQGYDFFLAPVDQAKVPTAWRDKPVYQPEYYAGQVVRLPTCYDFYALAHWPAATDAERRQIEEVVAYLSDARFQDAPNGYLWDRAKRRCYGAGRVYMACLNPNRTLLFLEWAARFAVCRRQPWFRAAFATLEGHRTEAGTYRLPPESLREQRNSYYIYAGAHMGLGENRRRPDWREIESTFRMLNIRRLMGMAAD